MSLEAATLSEPQPGSAKNEEDAFLALHDAVANNDPGIGTIVDAGLRIEINKKVLANGEYLFFGAARERNKGRKCVGYIRAKDIPQERWENYHPRGEA